MYSILLFTVISPANMHLEGKTFFPKLNCYCSSHIKAKCMSIGTVVVLCSVLFIVVHLLFEKV